MVHGSRMLVLKFNLILMTMLLLSGNALSKTLKIDTLKPSITNGDLTLQRDGSGDIVFGDYSGFCQFASGTPTCSPTIDVSSSSTGVLAIANGGTGSAVKSFVDFLTDQSIGGVKTFSDDIILEGTGQLKLPEGTTAQRSGSPSDGMLRFNSDLNRFEGYKSSSWDELGGGGQGGINYILNPNFEADTTGYSTYLDAAGLNPVDGTGGTSLRLTLSQNETIPLRGLGDLKLAKTAFAEQGAGFSYDFTIDVADRAKKLTISFDYDASHPGYVDDDIRWSVYDVTNATLIRINGEDLKGGEGTHYAQFQTASDSVSYRLIAHVSSTNSSAYDVYFDNIKVGPREVVKGSIRTDSIAYTPTITGFGTASSVEFFYSRDGEDLIVRGNFTSGTSTAVEAQISLPSGLSIDGDKIPSILKVGSGNRNASTDNQFHILATGGDSFFNIGIQAAGWNGVVVRNGSDLLASGNALSFTARVPIAGWSSNAKMSEDLGGRDIVVEAGSNDGDAITSATEDIPFKTVTKGASYWTSAGNTGSGEADAFTSPETGEYLVEGVLRISTNSLMDLHIYVDGSDLKNISYKTNIIHDFSTTLSLTKGQVMTLRMQSGLTLSNAGGSAYNYIRITKLASPQTTFESETVAARYTNDNGQGITATRSPLVYNIKDYDTHNIYNSSTGQGNIPTTGKYLVTARATITSDLVFTTTIIQLHISKNGSPVDTSRHSAKVTGSMRHTWEVSSIIDFSEGDTFEIEMDQNSGSTKSLDSTSSIYSTFSIARIK